MKPIALGILLSCGVQLLLGVALNAVHGALFIIIAGGLLTEMIIDYRRRFQ